MVDMEIKEELIEEPKEELNIQTFMNDMQMLGDQIKDKNLVKPTFHYGDASVSNYLLWLVLGELMKLNDKLEVEEE